MTTQVIVLNGASSSGTSQIARRLQAVLPDPWLAVGVDTLIQAMPESMQSSDGGIEFTADGGVSVGPRLARRDRVRGMAVAQAEVHQGVVYDLDVDTTHTSSLVCAQTIAARAG